jgi:hypothetical protein
MLGAFATGALASALAAAGLTGVVLWVVGVVTAGGRPFDLTPAAMAIVGFVVGLVVLLAERVAHRRTRAASTFGEPWAFRGGGKDDPASRYGDPRG